MNQLGKDKAAGVCLIPDRVLRNQEILMYSVLELALNIVNGTLPYHDAEREIRYFFMQKKEEATGINHIREVTV